MISTQDLEAIAAGRVIDSTQAPQIARELIAARKVVNGARMSLAVELQLNPRDVTVGRNEPLIASLETSLKAYDAALERTVRRSREGPGRVGGRERAANGETQ